MSDPIILRLTGETRLPRVRVLSDFEALLIDPRFTPLLGYATSLEPGTVSESDSANGVITAAEEFDKRGKELTPFFELGGIAVVYGYAEAMLVSRQGRMYSERRETVASTHRWFSEHLQPPPRVLKPGDPFPFPSSEPLEPWMRPAHGEHIRVVEPGHAFAPYLETVGAYEAIFAKYVREFSNATILAENRAGEPVAIEFAAGRGAIVIVPPPIDSPTRGQVFANLQQLLRERMTASREWRLASENELDADEQQVNARHKEERHALTARRTAVHAIKASLFADTIVKRVIGYWERATMAGATHEDALQQLYKLMEVLEDRYGGERRLPEALGIDRSKLKAVKRLANSYDIRHANEDPEALPLPSFNDAITYGHEIVQAFLELRAGEMTKTASPSGGTT